MRASLVEQTRQMDIAAEAAARAARRTVVQIGRRKRREGGGRGRGACGDHCNYIWIRCPRDADAREPIPAVTFVNHRACRAPGMRFPFGNSRPDFPSPFSAHGSSTKESRPFSASRLRARPVRRDDRRRLDAADHLVSVPGPPAFHRAEAGHRGRVRKGADRAPAQARGRRRGFPPFPAHLASHRGIRPHGGSSPPSRRSRAWAIV